jgi:DNA mismatch repair protein MSH2
MKLDASASRALNLYPTAGDGGNKSMCLSGLLNRCRTAQGQRLLNQWINQPLVDKQKIEERLDLVEAFFENNDLRQIVQDDHLKKMPDFSRLSKKFQRKKGVLQDCIIIYQSVKRIPFLCAELSKYVGKHQTMIADVFVKILQEMVSDFNKYLDLIETTVDMEAVDRGESLIRAEFDEGFSTINRLHVHSCLYQVQVLVEI